MTTTPYARWGATPSAEAGRQEAVRQLPAVRARERADPLTYVRRSGLAALALLLAWHPAPVHAEMARTITWQTQLGPEVFRTASEQDRFVLLDLHAVWCHWCHVMDEETYGDRQVRALIAKRFLPVSVDADNDPGLASRYGAWGWPATIVLAPDGTEIVKRRGFIPAQQMASLLAAIIDDPSPGPSVGRAVDPGPTDAAALTDLQRQALQATYLAQYDVGHGGWGQIHKYVDAATIELALSQLDAGDLNAERRVRETLDANLNLIDPVWGGVYQYSDTADWRSPHYEKLLSYQADDLRVYSEAYARWHDPRYLEAAGSIRRYLAEFLTDPDGAFYVSQDADLSARVPGAKYYRLGDQGRRSLGLLRVDRHLYARENGWAIGALCRYFDVTGDAASLASAVRAAEWIVAHRSNAGGFRHDESDQGGPYLEDSLSMGGAFLALYRSTGERQWLSRAAEVLAFINAQLRHPVAGFIASPVSASAIGVFREPVRPYDQNAVTARLANLVHRYTGNIEYRQIAQHAMKWLVTIPPDDADLHADVLLADRQLGAPPTHITVVGAKADPAARSLHAAALTYPAPYLQIDWWDRSEGPLPNTTVDYPVLPRAAAFACSANACSLPVYEPDLLVQAVLASSADD